MIQAILIVHMENKSIEFFGTMKEIEKEAGKDFIRCHRAYLVNKQNIKEKQTHKRQDNQYNMRQYTSCMVGAF